jgi:hypothetical protein
MTRAKLNIIVLTIVASSSAYAFREALSELALPGGNVELLDPGAAPRKPLRYRYQDPPRSFKMVTQSGMYLIRGVLQGEESYLPPTASRWDLVEAQGEGCARWRLGTARALDDEKAGDETVKATRAVVDGLIGKEVTTCVGRRGQLALTLPPPASPAERQILDLFRAAFELQFTIPLPKQAVGKGARWRVTRLLPLAADGIIHELTYELNDVAEKGLDANVTMAFSTRPHAVAGSDASIIVDQVSGSGQGRVVAMLSELTPVQSDLTFETVMSLTPSESRAVPTEEERARGYKMVYRARQLMQADALGPLDWESRDDLPQADD